MRAAGLVLAALALWGCSGSLPAARAPLATAELEPGATRESVREALGAPWLESRYWKVEVYRAERRGLALVRYDADGRVLEQATGARRRGGLFGAGGERGWPTLRSGSLSLVADAPSRDRLLLLADAEQVPAYVALRARASSCTLIVGCDSPQDCPDRVAIDGGEPIDPRPLEVLCTHASVCPPGEPIGEQRVRVPLLHALGLKPGLHRLRVSSSALRGDGEARFVCRAGDVMHGLVRGRATGASWWSRGTLSVRVAFPAVFPPAWSGNALALHRADRWLVDPEPDAR